MNSLFCIKIVQGIKYKSFKNFNENREKTDRSIFFNQVVRVSFVDAFSGHLETHLPLTLIEISILKEQFYRIAKSIFYPTHELYLY